MIKSDIKNLVFEGGGVKGIAYAGALYVLDKAGILKDIERVAGTSAGAIVATFLAIGMPVKEIERQMVKADFGKFANNSFGFIRDLFRLVFHFGVNKGDYFYKWMEGIIEEYCGDPQFTFRQLAASKKHGENPFWIGGRAHLYLIATNLSTGRNMVFSNETTPDVPIVDAVRYSMSIPFYFVAPRWDGMIMTDGGVLNNYPIRTFDYNKYIDNIKPKKLNVRSSSGGFEPAHNEETLGFRLDTSKEMKKAIAKSNYESISITNIIKYIKEVIKILIDSQDSLHVTSEDWRRTVYINTLGIKTTDFNLSDERKKNLIMSGKAGVKNFLGWLDLKAENEDGSK